MKKPEGISPMTKLAESAYFSIRFHAPAHYLQRSSSAGSVATKPVTGESLSTIFCIVWLLTGSTAHAEQALANAISLVDSEMLSEQVLLLASVRFALANGSVVNTAPGKTDVTKHGLPIELHRIFLLPTDQRYCFVLRVLAGLSCELCCRLLNRDRAQIEESTGRALVALSGMRQG